MEPLATSNSESLLQVKIICQHKIPKLLQTIKQWGVAHQSLYTHTVQVGVHSPQKEPNHLPPPEFKMSGNVTVLKIPSSWNESEQQRKNCLLLQSESHIIAEPQNGARADILTGNYCTSKQIIILCSDSVNREQNVLVNS